MPTLTWLDSFAHQQAASVFYGTGAGVYDTNSGVANFSFPAGRKPGSVAMMMVQDGVTATRVGKLVPAGNRTVVESFYVKIGAIPSVASTFWVGISFINAQLRVMTDGTVQYSSGSAADKVVDAGAVYANDGLWHRIDLKWVTSGTTYTFDLSWDGVAQTQHVSNATTAADITEIRLGSSTTGHTGTFTFADWVRSVTAGDHPIGPHQVRALIPDADGAHNWTSTHMGPSSGGVASSVSTLWQEVDDFGSGSANTTDYIQYALTTATSTEYAEITLPDVGPAMVVWAARAVAAIFSAATQANSATTRVVDGSGATALDLYVGDQSDTSLRHQAAMIPSITTPALLNALKFRVGFPTDSNPAPRWSALLIDYAIPEQVSLPMPGRVVRNQLLRT
jgi:hypothetical protein